MRNYTLTHLTDTTLLRELTTLVSRDRETTALILAHIAEVDIRRAYVPEGYSSMFSYCVERLRLSEDAASKRIQAARAARRVPALFSALADGRLHLSAVWLLAPHITLENADELIEASTHQRKSGIEVLLARRFPAFRPPTSAAWIMPVGSGMKRGPFGDSLFDEHAPGHVEALKAEHAPGHVAVEDVHDPHSPGHVRIGIDGVKHAPGHVETAPPERYLVRVTIGRSTHDKLRYAQQLLSHAVPSGDVAQVLDRALDALIARIERRKLGATRTGVPSASKGDPHPSSNPGSSHRRSGTGRTATRFIPARVRRAVWERDEGRCTFVGAAGRRCESRRFLEFDHVDAFARGGAATVEGLRLRCRAHNQYGAEHVFGAEFMRCKRDQARLARREAAKRRLAIAQKEAQDREAAARKEQAKDLEAGLRGLGCRVDEARRAAGYAMAIESATFEERLRAALAFRSRRTITRSNYTDACEVRERRARYSPRAWERRAPRSPRLYTGNESRFGTAEAVSALVRPALSAAQPA